MIMSAGSHQHLINRRVLSLTLKPASCALAKISMTCTPFFHLAHLHWVDPPSFCTQSDSQGEDSQASRKHLSLCGVVVADMVPKRQHWSLFQANVLRTD